MISCAKMSLSESSISASAMTNILSSRSGAMSEPLDCTTPPVLDLCTRKRSRSRSPNPEGARHVKMSPSPTPKLCSSPNSIDSSSNDNLREKMSPLSDPIQNSFDQNNQKLFLIQNSLAKISSSVGPFTDTVQKCFDQNNQKLSAFGDAQIQTSLAKISSSIAPFTDAVQKCRSPNFDQTSFGQIANPLLTPPPQTYKSDSSEEESVVSESAMEFNASYPLNTGVGVNARSNKPTRPFKAYPKDPFFLAIGASTADSMLGKESAEAYAEFRHRMLSQVRASNPPPGVTNTKMRRSSVQLSQFSQDGGSDRDASYWEKRRKNNEAAKRSRDARRAKEDEIAIRAAFLEQENLKLKYEIAALRNETTKLRCLLYN